MTPKIQKIVADIEKTRERIRESQDRLRELERQKTELENTEIVALFRALDVPPDQLPAFIAAMKERAALPETSPAAPVSSGAAVSTPYASGYTREQEDTDNED